ncbi:MAG TPA: TIM barrel protein [Acidobacteriaceae bacterium]|nr:TIM barrel protein [Acidobacteriaceae bacterium]
MLPENPRSIDRRQMLKTAVAGSAAMLATGEMLKAEGQAAPAARKGRIHQSACKWCYPKISLDDFCKAGAEIGLKGIDLLGPEEYEVPKKYGLVCSMGYVGAGDIPNGLNRVENHDKIEEALKKNLPLAAKAGVPNVITFSGNRKNMSDWDGARNTIKGLKRVKQIVEDSGVILNVELLNSKVNHPDYMCDHTAWGVLVMEEVNSPNIKLLYDIYHMQIMEGDLIATIKANIQWLGHFHTGGVPGRHELDNTQEINWVGVMNAIADSGYKGYVAHEFLPTADPLTSLRQAVTLCDV